MRPGHHDIARITARGLGDDVLGRRDPTVDIREDAHRDTRGGGPLHTARVRRADRRDAAGVATSQRDRRNACAGWVGGVALVEEHDADGSGPGGVRGLDLERAVAALHESDVACRKGREVVCGAAAGAGVANSERQVDRRHRGGDVTGVRLRGHPEVGALHVGGRDRERLLQGGRPQLAEEQELELLPADDVAGALQPLLDVVGRRVVARGPGRARAAVLVGDPLECPLVLEHSLERDALQQLADRVVGAVAAAWFGSGLGRLHEHEARSSDARGGQGRQRVGDGVSRFPPIRAARVGPIDRT